MKEYYHVIDGSFDRYYFAQSEADAIRIYSENYFADQPVAAKVYTDQGYPIVRLGDIPEGTHFHRVSFVDHQFCELSATWCRGPYLKDVKMCECNREDGPIAHTKHMKREERVTIEPYF